MSDLDDLINATAPLTGDTGAADALNALLGITTPEPATEADSEPEPPRNDPFGDVDYTGNLEQDTKAELTAAQAAFRDRAKTYKKQRLLVEDSEFWVAVCFRTREDKERFLTDHNLIHLGDKYLNGYLVDQALNGD